MRAGSARRRVRFAPGPLSTTPDGHPAGEGRVAKPVRQLENSWGKVRTSSRAPQHRCVPSCVLRSGGGGGAVAKRAPCSNAAQTRPGVVRTQGITKRNVLQLVELLLSDGGDQVYQPRCTRGHPLAHANSS